MPRVPEDFIAFLFESGNTNDREKVFRQGESATVRELALWDEILACEERNKPKPEWARQGLIEYAKTKFERIKHDEQRQIIEDYAVFELVQHFRTKIHRPKRGKAKPFTLNRAFQHAAQEWYPKQEITPSLIQNVRRSYVRTLKRNERGFYISGQILKEQEIVARSRAKK